MITKEVLAALYEGQETELLIPNCNWRVIRMGENGLQYRVKVGEPFLSCCWNAQELLTKLSTYEWRMLVKPMNWGAAVQALKEGKRVRREKWVSHLGLAVNEHKVLDTALGIADYEAVDWVVCE